MKIATIKRWPGLLAGAAALLMFSSCAKEVPIGGDPYTGEGETQVVLRLKTPGGYSPGTRALGEADESKIADLYVLAFDDADKLTGIRKGTLNEAKTAYSVNITPTASNKTGRLVVLANAESILNATIKLDATSIGDSYTTVKGKLVTDFNEPLAHTAGSTLPMWGNVTSKELSAGMNIPVELLRAVARIDVGIGTFNERGNNEDDVEGSWGGLGNFTLEAVYVVRPNSQYSLIPTATISDDNEVENPSNIGSVLAVSETFGYSDITGNGLTRSIYVPEAGIKSLSSNENHLNRMAIVVKGRYASDTRSSFYRLDFVNGSTWYDVLRNHLYRFRITQVSGSGYISVDEAYKSAAINMTATVTPWDDNNMGNGAWAGEQYIYSDRNLVDFFQNGILKVANTDVIKLESNLKQLTLYGEGWDPAGSGKWKKGTFTVTVASAGTNEFALTVEATGNSVASDITERFTVGNSVLSIPVTLKQDKYQQYRLTTTTDPETVGGTISIEAEMENRIKVTVVDKSHNYNLDISTGTAGVFAGVYSESTGGTPITNLTNMSADTFYIAVNANTKTEPRAGTFTLTLTEGVGDDRLKATHNVFQQKATVIPGKGGGGEVNTANTKASEYILAVDENGVLNLDGLYDANTNPNGRANNYTVLFKWGSVVALNNAGGATAVAWVPEGFTGQTNTWANIPYADGSAKYVKGNSYGSGDFPKWDNDNNVKAGYGDPCRLAAKNGHNTGDFRMPVASGTSVAPWLESSVWETWISGSGRKGSSGVFYPAAGARYNSDGTLYSVGSYGFYWSATQGGTYDAYALYVYSGTPYVTNGGNRSDGFAVRCVPAE